MHSFVPSLSFLLPALALASSCARAAAQVVPVQHDHAARDLGHASRFGAAHRRHAAEVGRPLNEHSDVILYPGRRAAGASFTYFVTGLGACGGFNVPSDFIVALNMEQFDSGNHCGEVITITAKGKTAQATIADRCEGCGWNNLDFTEGLYRFFDPTMFGTIQGEWEYGAGAPAKPKPTPTPTPTPKPKPTPTPTPTPTPAKITSSSTTKSKTSTSTSSSTSTKSSSSSSSSTSTSSSATSSASAASLGGPTGAGAGNIEGIYEAFLSMGSAMMGGGLGSSN